MTERGDVIDRARRQLRNPLQGFCRVDNTIHHHRAEAYAT